MSFDPAKKYGKINVMFADLHYQITMARMITDEIRDSLKDTKIKPYSPLQPMSVRLEEAELWFDKTVKVLVETKVVNLEKMNEYFDITYNIDNQNKDSVQ